ncbi:putative E3 ubiquitin-protein ligase HECTD1 [Paratrimastix pyriformis]|uniref:E3 ubiquitin-protein ligase HECTD1 n=1 Tax=Paratrimastix pyriformis TaxID=342808 RepID=A0ABQ8U5T2_9EUKA|nr:putative E3 ubiquitin-protein ligase HECTD1 [Paratrimastix pyriformis]
MEGGAVNNNDTLSCKKKRSPCRPRKELEYVTAIPGDDENWRCPACLGHYEDPVCLSCGDSVCRACVTLIDGVCPTCTERFIAEHLCPSRVVQRLVKQTQCRCPNRGLGCDAVVGVLDVEHHLGAECEWRQEECDQCHQQVRRAEMARHKDTTCARKPMACGYADVGCPTRCPQEDLAAHERDGVAAHMGLLRRRLADTSADLTQCKADLTLCKAELAQTKEQTQRELAAIRSQIAQCLVIYTPWGLCECMQIGPLTYTRVWADIRTGVMSRSDFRCPPTPECTSAAQSAYIRRDPMVCRLRGTSARCVPARVCCPPQSAQGAPCRLPTSPVFGAQVPTCRPLRHVTPPGIPPDPGLFTPPAAPEGLAARWDEATKKVPGIYAGAAPVGDPAPACCALAAAATPPPPPGPPVRSGVVQATPSSSSSNAIVVYTGPECRWWSRFPEGGKGGATATCTPGTVVFRYDHDMDDQGLFYYIGTQGRTKPWHNPALAGWVTVTRSSDCYGEPTVITGRQPCNSYTGNEPNAWWQVDLGAERLFTPTRYTLRHCDLPAHVDFRLQSWRLEGSADGADGSWRTLDEHANEPNALAARPDAMATFAVAPERAFPARRFRVLMTGPCSGHYYLMLSGLEMYGTLSPSGMCHCPRSLIGTVIFSGEKTFVQSAFSDPSLMNRIAAAIREAPAAPDPLRGGGGHVAPG